MSSPNEHDRGDDPFAPPAVPILVVCLHCGEEYDSWQLERREDPALGSGGHWCCPTPGCGGVGFGFDILPADGEWTDEDGNGWHYCDDDEDYDFEGCVDAALIDEFWSTDSRLHDADWPDKLAIASEEEEPPLKRLLPPEELPAEMQISQDDIPF